MDVSSSTEPAWARLRQPYNFQVREALRLALTLQANATDALITESLAGEAGTQLRERLGLAPQASRQDIEDVILRAITGWVPAGWHRNNIAAAEMHARLGFSDPATPTATVDAALQGAAGQQLREALRLPPTSSRQEIVRRLDQIMRTPELRTQ